MEEAVLKAQEKWEAEQKANLPKPVEPKNNIDSNTVIELKKVQHPLGLKYCSRKTICMLVERNYGWKIDVHVFDYRTTPCL